MELLTFAVACVYLQPLFFIWTFNKSMPISPGTVKLLGLAVAGALAVTGFKYGFYTNEILIFYALTTVFVIHHYRDRPGFQSVSLGFLVIFLNSFYWEIPIHLSNILIAPGLVIFQSTHLYVVPFLLGVGFVFPKRWWYWTVAMWAVVGALSASRMLFYFFDYQVPILNLVCRAVGLYTLLWVLQFPGYGDKLIFCAKDNIVRVLCGSKRE